MSTSATASRAGVVLIASGDEWSARALESVLEPRGYRVLRVATGAAALERARSALPDFILIAADLPDLTGEEVCRELRQDPSIPPGVPIIGLTSAAATREQRLSWLRAGAWELFGPPFDVEELLLKLDRYLSGKLDVLQAWGVVLADQATGLYNERGLRRRARELVAEALRAHTAVACVVFGPDLRGEQGGAASGAAGVRALRARVGSVLRTYARLSDVVGWWNGSEFVVLAPGTDADGAAKLAARLSHAIETAPREPGASVPALEVRAGYEAVSDAHATPVEPDDLLVRASTALQLARQGGELGARIRRFEARC